MSKALNDEETGGNVDFDYENASGNTIVDILNRGKKKKIIPVKKYQDFLKSASLTEMKKYFAGKNIYTLVNDVKIRERPYVNNGIMNSITGTVKNSGTFLGKVSYVLKNTDDNKIWFGITSEDSNKFIPNIFDYSQNGGRNTGAGLYDSSYHFYNDSDIMLNWVRADVVVVDLSDARALTDKYKKYHFNDPLPSYNYQG